MLYYFTFYFVYIVRKPPSLREMNKTNQKRKEGMNMEKKYNNVLKKIFLFSRKNKIIDNSDFIDIVYLFSRKRKL